MNVNGEIPCKKQYVSRNYIFGKNLKELGVIQKSQKQLLQFFSKVFNIIFPDFIMVFRVSPTPPHLYSASGIVIGTVVSSYPSYVRYVEWLGHGHATAWSTIQSKGGTHAQHIEG